MKTNVYMLLLLVSQRHSIVRRKRKFRFKVNKMGGWGGGGGGGSRQNF